MPAGSKKVLGFGLVAAAAAAVMYLVVGREKPRQPAKPDDVVAAAPAASPQAPAETPAAPPPTRAVPSAPAPRGAFDAGAGAVVPPSPPPTEPPNAAPRTTTLSATEYAAEQMQMLRQLVETDPERAVAIARQANRRFPKSPDVPERSWIVVKGLAKLKRFQEARDEANALVARYADNNFARDAERLLKDAR